MDKYSFVQRLGQGSFAVVWKARRKSDGRLVAVKQLKQSPESWDACKQLPEVRSAAVVTDRRHLVQLLEAVRHGGELFLVFEYIEGNLHHCIALSRRMDESQARWAARRLLSALAAVHAAGLVHCDVKPENILVGADGGSYGAPTLKLCDFGQAAPPGEIGTYVGTRWYRPPELFLGSRGDVSLDIWGAGCTIAELFLKRPLVPGSDSRDMLFRISGELGPPDETQCWPLAAQMIEASGRSNALPAAWDALRAAGASQAAVDLLHGLLQYDGTRRWRADRALRDSPFFAPDLPEMPVVSPAARPLSPETLRRSREEAQAVERKLLSKDGPSSPRGSGAPGFGSGFGFGLGALRGSNSVSSFAQPQQARLPANGLRASPSVPSHQAHEASAPSMPSPERVNGAACGSSAAPVHKASVAEDSTTGGDDSDEDVPWGIWSCSKERPIATCQSSLAASSSLSTLSPPMRQKRVPLGGSVATLARAPRQTEGSPAPGSLGVAYGATIGLEPDDCEATDAQGGPDDEALAERFWTECRAK
mmetsp:Transcript_48097/g.86536  ORF Transcript_48097/g.86536 Transcript_48097/m.86536 type:complete len:534 (-) Transcript_48097:188-1789(-)